MSKFKVGDRIKSNFQDNSYGKSGVIQEIVGGGCGARVLFDAPFDGWGDHQREWHVEMSCLNLILPRFKVGDRVRYKNDHTKVFTVAEFPMTTYPFNGGRYIGSAPAVKYVGSAGWDFADTLELAPPVTPATTNRPCIVARVSSGAPRPAANPFVHVNQDAAKAEAERLATSNPGVVFETYELVARSVAQQPVAKTETV